MFQLAGHGQRSGRHCTPVDTLCELLLVYCLVCALTDSSCTLQALAFNNPIGNTKYCVTQLNFKAESAAETVAHVKGGKKARQAVRDELARAKTHEDMAVALGMDPSIEKARQVEEVLSVLTARLAERPERPREPSEAGSEIEGHLRVLEERAAPEVTAAQPLDSAHHMPEWQAEERGRTLVDAV